MTDRIRLFHSLNARVLLTMLLALLCGAGVFLGVRFCGNYLIQKSYMSADAVSARRLETFNEFKAYVLANQISSRDSARIGNWSRGKPYVTVIVYGDQTRIEAGQWGAAAQNASANAIPEIIPTGSYFLRFSDGVYAVSISESSEERVYTLCTTVSLLLGSLVTIAVMLLFIHRITSRVSSLARSARQIGRGDLDQEIRVSGRDEVALLGREMDNMRRSITERIEAERQARQANSSLITAISHDLRTPMTAMIGYLELLQNKGYGSEEQRERFVSTAHSKAMELKDLTDELFKYFLVFGGEDLALETEVYDAGILLDQLLGEQIIELRDSGYRVRTVRIPDGCYIEVDVLHLKRAFDNLFSNIRKYADPARPVIVRGEVNNNFLSVCFSNTKSTNVGKIESSKIGLQTCKKIAEALHGSFQTWEDESHFSAEITLPLAKADDTEAPNE